jgi:TetR/AcrR family transcriptional repressor of nem operon
VRYPADEVAKRHERIVKEAARLFRKRGFKAVTVAEVMQAAGLTHGAFYSHFSSKEELMAAAVDEAMRVSVEGLAASSGTATGRRAYRDAYLSTKHRDGAESGCTMAALSGEIRNEPETKAAFTARLKETVAAAGGDRAETLLAVSAMVGAVALARAVDDDAFSEEILQKVRAELRRKTGD